jgi:Tfp pilus assembly protein PilP
VVVCPAAFVAAQSPAQTPAEEAPAQEAGADTGQVDEILEGDEAVLSGEAYNYDPAGRRDPFVSLLARTQLVAPQAQRPEGVPGLLIDEISIQGIFELNGRMFTQVQTADKEKSYLIQEGDQLYDGEVVSITQNEVVFKQLVNDPSVIKPFREVVKKLNPES